MNTNINVKKLDERAKLPTYGSAYAAGADLYALTDSPIEIAPHQTVFVHTGIAIELPLGLVGLVYARSGIACKRDLAPANKVGVIDCDYRGEIMVAVHNHGTKAQTIENGEAVILELWRPDDGDYYEPSIKKRFSDTAYKAWAKTGYSDDFHSYEAMYRRIKRYCGKSPYAHIVFIDPTTGDCEYYAYTVFGALEKDVRRMRLDK